MGRFAILLLCVAPAMAAPVPKTVKKVAPTLPGIWEVVERQNDGQLLKKFGREFWVVTNDTYAIFDGVQDVADLSDPQRQRATGKWSSPDSQDPCAINLDSERFQNISRWLLEGDTLHLASGIDEKKLHRPAEAKPGQGVSYIKFQRVDPTKLKAPSK